MKNSVRIVLVGGLLLWSSGAMADNNIEVVPTGWRLQDYTNGAVVAYYTPSTCTSGQVNISSTASADDRNRFWSTVMTAKALSRPVGIYYETTSGVCNITSFYFP